jgi:hypothetical protein
MVFILRALNGWVPMLIFIFPQGRHLTLFANVVYRINGVFGFKLGESAS